MAENVDRFCEGDGGAAAEYRVSDVAAPSFKAIVVVYGLEFREIIKESV